MSSSSAYDLDGRRIGGSGEDIEELEPGGEGRDDT